MRHYLDKKNTPERIFFFLALILWLTEKEFTAILFYLLNPKGFVVVVDDGLSHSLHFCSFVWFVYDVLLAR